MAPSFYPFEVTIPHITYAVLGGFVVIFGMFSLILREKLYIGEACWAFIFGIIIGPYGANIFNPHNWGDEKAVNTITLEFTRVVLAIGVFAIGVELPKQYMKKHWKTIAFLLAPIMTYGWFISAALIYALIPPLNFLSSLAVAACLTPTDPILAAAVIGGKYADKHVPAHIRHMLAAESGCNDGAAFPFLFLALYLTVDHNTRLAVQHWFTILWLYQIVLGTLIGAVVGYAFRHLMKFGERHDLIDRHSYVAQYVSLALFVLGSTVLLGSDDLLATFACGTAFAWDGFFNRQTEESMFSSVIDLLFNIATFIYIGAWMPFHMFNDHEIGLDAWRLVVIALLVMLLRRLPVVMAMYKWIPDIKTWREALFTGHFGPIGVGAVFISTLATEFLEKHEHGATHQQEQLTKLIQPIVAFMVLISITVHGLSIPSFSLGRRVRSVSRTWSRHNTAPDWTNQVQPVTRGGSDIVVNRDSEIEKGEGSPDLSIARQASSTGTMTATLGGAGNGEKLRHSIIDERQREYIPDGCEVLAVWKEGSHTIIERRAGPGEEVQVEVIGHHDPNMNLHSFGAMASKFFQGERDAVRGEIEHYFSRFVRHHDHSEHKDEDRTPLSPSSSRDNERGGDQGEEVSDSDENDATSATNAAVSNTSPSRRASKKRRPRPASSSSSTTPKFVSPSKQGRRGLFHRSAASEDQRPQPQPQQLQPPLSPQPQQVSRGRPSTAPSYPSSPSLRNLRVNNLISGEGERREASPSRAIWFSDEHRRGSFVNSPNPNNTADESAPSRDESIREGVVEDAGSSGDKTKVHF